MHVERWVDCTIYQARTLSDSGILVTTCVISRIIRPFKYRQVYPVDQVAALFILMGAVALHVYCGSAHVGLPACMQLKMTFR